jgi:hypothetical protein
LPVRAYDSAMSEACERVISTECGGRACEVVA